MKRVTGLISRRAWLWAPSLGIFLSSYAAAKPHGRPVFTLADMLVALPSIRSMHDLTERFGMAQEEGKFGFGPHLFYKTREDWAKGKVATPPDLVERVSIGARVLAYDFLWDFDVFNPQGGNLRVFAGESDLMVGWDYDERLQHHEAKARIRT